MIIFFSFKNYFYFFAFINLILEPAAAPFLAPDTIVLNCPAFLAIFLKGKIKTIKIK